MFVSSRFQYIGFCAWQIIAFSVLSYLYISLLWNSGKIVFWFFNFFYVSLNSLCLFLHLTKLWILVTILFAVSLFMSCFGCCSIFIFHLCWFVGRGCCEKQLFADSLQNIILWRMLLCFAVSFFTFFELFCAYENS